MKKIYLSIATLFLAVFGFIANAQDTTPPTVICQDISVYLDSIGNASITATDIDNGSYDNVGIDTMYLNQYDFDCEDVASPIHITLYAVDLAGNIDSCVALATLLDTIPPDVSSTCNDTTIYLYENGYYYNSLDNFLNIHLPVDNCHGIIIGSTWAAPTVRTPPPIPGISFDCDDIGVNEVIIYSSDGFYNTSSCSMNVTVLDTHQLLVTCRPPITRYLDGNGYVDLTLTDVSSGASCSADSLAINQTHFTCADVGIHPIIVTAFDLISNTSTCTTQVTILDTFSLSTSCHDHTVFLDANGEAILTPGDILVGSPCGLSVAEVDQELFTCADVGTNTVTLTYTDTTGHSGSCSATVTVVDGLGPTLECRDDTIYIEDFPIGIDPGELLIDADDACGLHSLTENGQPLGGTPNPPQPTFFFCDDVGEFDFVYVATDFNGNTNTCYSTLTILDTTPPELVCLDSVLYRPDFIYSPYDLVDASDGCLVGGVSVQETILGIAEPQSVPPPIWKEYFLCEDVGVHEYFLTVQDGSGNTASCISTVTVLDTLPVVAACTQSYVYLDSTGVGTADAEDLIDYTTGCAYASAELDTSFFTCADVGAYPVTLTITDTMGNLSSCTTVVNVRDYIAPVVECRDTILYIDSFGYAFIQDADTLFDAFDACGIASFSYGIIAFGPPPEPEDPFAPDLSFNCPDIGTSEILLTVYDANGNSSTCTSTITILDTTPPEIVCHDTTLYLSGNNISYADAYIWNGNDLVDYNDNCGVTGYNMLGGWGGRSYVPPIPPPPDIVMSCVDVGEINEVLYTVNDASGNTSSCVSVVTVIDTLPPIIYLPSDITVCSENINGAIVTYNYPTYVDACGTDSLWQLTGLPSGGLYPMGVTTNTFQARDVNGNVTTRSFTVTVIEGTPANANFSISGNNCPDSEFEFTSVATDTSYGYSWDFGDGNNANGMTTLHSYASTDSYDVTLNVENSLGCMSSFTQTVSLLLQPSLNMNITDATCHGLSNGMLMVSATGNPSFSYSLDGNPLTSIGTFIGLEAGPHSIEVTDVNGCTNENNFTINAPQAISLDSILTSGVDCESDLDGSITVEATGGIAPYMYSIDNGSNHVSGTFNYLSGGAHQVTVTDANGCSYTETVMVNSNTPLPVADFDFTLNGLSFGFDNTSTGADSYHWDFGDGSTSSQAEPNHSYNANGAYHVTLIVSNDCGSDTISHWVNMIGIGIEDIDSDLFIDISPNPNDGSFTLQLEAADVFNSLELRIWSIEGKLIDIERLNASGSNYKGSLNYSLASGVYTLELIVDDTSYHKRLVVK